MAYDRCHRVGAQPDGGHAQRAGLSEGRREGCRSLRSCDLISTEMMSRPSSNTIVDNASGPWTIPVLLVHYFPVRDGRIDVAVTGDVDPPLDSVRQHTVVTTRQVVEALESGSGDGTPAPLRDMDERFGILDDKKRT